MSKVTRIYVAGASAEPERVRRWMDACTQAGMHITCDWLDAIAKEGLTHEQRLAAADDDHCGVLEADVLWLLAPEVPSAGCWVELGIAIEARRTIVVSGPARTRCIFAACGIEFDDDEAAFEALQRMASERAA